jgi:thymidylate kinase
LNTLTTRYENRGRLLVAEGLDGAGKAAQLGLLAESLALTPMTFSWLHATDIADRLLCESLASQSRDNDLRNAECILCWGVA